MTSTAATNAKRRIVTVVGARPQFIKAAALRAAFDASADFHEILVHTGQHYDTNMSGVFFQELGLRPPEHRLAVEGRSHGAMTGQMLDKIEEILVAEAPDALLVYGDTNSTLAGALAATKMHIPVIHVEAGLRSFNKAMPEEVNRILTDHVSTLLFCSTTAGVDNLANENIRTGVHMVGDIMYDVTLRFGALADKEALRKRYGRSGKPLALMTLHRAENFSKADRAREVLSFIDRYTADYDIVFPVHPGTRAKLEQLGVPLPAGVEAVDPLPYIELQGLLAVSELVLTDSGGLQKEAYFHRTPCITLRDETEWVETIAAGWNALWTDPVHKPQREIEEYGHGDTAERILGVMRQSL
jgi:UDP-GlcNAc3NAcA epimerase